LGSGEGLREGLQQQQSTQGSAKLASSGVSPACVKRSMGTHVHMQVQSAFKLECGEARPWS
jgi:hypothetical protein